MRFLKKDTFIFTQNKGSPLITSKAFGETLPFGVILIKLNLKT